MTTQTVVTAVLLVVVPIVFNAAFFALQRAFDYPDILRRPTDEILRRFRDGGSGLRRLWYIFAASAALFIPVPVLVQGLFPDPPWFLAVGTVFGVLAGIVQVVGLLRWPFVVGGLAEMYLAPDATAAKRDAVSVVFEALHRYAGVAIGEHLGYLFTAIWTILLCLAVVLTGIVGTWVGWLGLPGALMIFCGLFEEAGWKPAGAITAIGYVLWSLWLIVFGVSLLV
jgi:hypothetical protein